MVGLGKIFGRPGQFLKVWKKIIPEKLSRKKCMEKIQGVKNFGNEGERRFREILSCPPKMHVAPQMPPQIPRPGAATASDFCLACLLGHLSPIFVMFPSLDMLRDMFTSNISSREIS